MKFIRFLIAPIIAIIIYALSVSFFNLEPKLADILLTITMGIVIDILWLQHQQKENIKKILNTDEVTLEILKNEESIKLAVKTMYQSSANKITSSHLYPDNYKPPVEDLALSLSKKNNTSVHRIIAINNIEQEEWVKSVYENKPDNYFIKVVTNLPKRPSYPNFVLLEKDDMTKLLISFNSDSTEGFFAFTTNSKKLSNGMRDYINHIYAQAQAAEDYFKSNNGK